MPSLRFVGPHGAVAAGWAMALGERVEASGEGLWPAALMAEAGIAGAPGPASAEAHSLYVPRVEGSPRQVRDQVGRWVAEQLRSRGWARAFGPAVRGDFLLEPGMTFLNHGSFGATPRAVLEVQQRLQRELEAQPMRFMSSLPQRLSPVAARVASLLGSPASDLVFVHNATSGVNAVLRSLELGPEDHILTTTHAYGAVSRSLAFIADRRGCVLERVAIPFPLASAEELVRAIRRGLDRGVRLVVLDHISSVTGLVSPMEELVALCHEAGAQVLVDGAHVPGQLPVDLQALGADWWVGNLHKWLFTPKGCAVLYAKPSAQEGLAPLVISHGYGHGLGEAFHWQGTHDPTGWLAVEAALAFVARHGGVNAIRAHNILLADQAVGRVRAAFPALGPRPAPASMCAALIALPLPWAGGSSEANALEARLWDAHRVQSFVGAFEGQLWLRIGAQIYNSLEDYDRLGHALSAL